MTTRPQGASGWKRDSLLDQAQTVYYCQCEHSVFDLRLGLKESQAATSLGISIRVTGLPREYFRLCLPKKVLMCYEKQKLSLKWSCITYTGLTFICTYFLPEAIPKSLCYLTYVFYVTRVLGQRLSSGVSQNQVQLLTPKDPNSREMSGGETGKDLFQCDHRTEV
jgi:hypothetical protein